MAKGGKISYRVSNMAPIFNAVRALYSDLTQEKEELDKLGKFVRDRIVAETRKGNDLSKDGADQPELSEGYIAYRRRLGGKIKNATKDVLKGASIEQALEKRGIKETTPIPDSTFFKPAKSNLTLTGQLLNSIDYSIRIEDRAIIIEPTGVRDDGKTNKEVARELATRKTRLAPNGRKFLGLDERGFKRIRNFIVEAIRRLALKKGL